MFRAAFWLFRKLDHDACSLSRLALDVKGAAQAPRERSGDG